jgi:hypothetical protein
MTTLVFSQLHSTPIEKLKKETIHSDRQMWHKKPFSNQKTVLVGGEDESSHFLQ